MAHRYVHIGINFGEGAPRILETEPAIRVIADDWIRYTPSNWIVWTTKSNAEICDVMRRVLTLNDQFLVVEISQWNRDGFHYEWVWAWLNEDRTQGYRPPPLQDLPNLLPNPPLVKKL